jgi:hypothetical protein
VITVKQMREALKKLPDDLPLCIEVDAYYHEGERQNKDAVDLPVRDGDVVCIGSVYAQP